MFESLSRLKVVRATGSSAIATSLTPPISNVLLVSVRLHLSATGGASEDFTITINSETAAAYDVKIYSQDMQTIQDLMWTPDQPVPIINGDVLDFAYANSNSRTYGLEIIYISG